MDQCLPCLSPGDKAHSTSPRRLSSRAEDWRRCWERRMVQELQMQIRHIRKMVLLYTGPLELRWRERYDILWLFFLILCNFSCWSCWTSFISPTPFCGMLWCSIASFPVSNWALAVVVTSNLRKTTATAAMGSWDVMDVRCMRQLNIIRDALKIWPSASTESWACLH